MVFLVNRINNGFSKSLLFFTETENELFYLKGFLKKNNNQFFILISLYIIYYISMNI